MQLTPQAQAIMLLTVSFGKSDRERTKPLSTGEWARLASWLKDHSLDPADLLKSDLSSLLARWMDRSVSVERLQKLFGRGAALGLALEKWQRAGVWVLTRSDPGYPKQLKSRLRSESPAVLFGCGNQALLNQRGIAVVGSRDASDEDLAFTKKLGKEAAAQGYSVVSGGARGVDQTAMLGALESEGTAVGVLADSFIRSATSAAYRKSIMSGDLVLVTPFNPEAGFNVGNAMSRNRYIYCLADAGVIVSSTPDKGGTWSGALEAMKAAWVPIWVKHSASPKSGNPKLVEMGVNWFPDDLKSLETLFEGSRLAADKAAPADVLLPATDPASAEAESKQEAPESRRIAEETANLQAQPEKATQLDPAASSLLREADFYSLFLARMQTITAVRPMTANDIATHFKLEKMQVNAWLKRGVGDGKIRKLTRPVRYQVQTAERQQASLFGDEE